MRPLRSAFGLALSDPVAEVEAGPRPGLPHPVRDAADHGTEADAERAGHGCVGVLPEQQDEVVVVADGKAQELLADLPCIADLHERRLTVAHAQVHATLAMAALHAASPNDLDRLERDGGYGWPAR